MDSDDYSASPNKSLSARLAGLVLRVVAAGEFGVGVAVVVFPSPMTGLLLGAPLEGVGSVVARLAGIAIAALGITWWLARRNLNKHANHVAPGFVLYNFGVGFLFLFYALVTTLVVPFTWLVAFVHLLSGVVFCAAIVFRR